MPRYFMHICNGAGFVEDQEGTELPNVESARKRAIQSARGVTIDDLRDGNLDLTPFIDVEDEERHILFTLTFADAVDITAKHRADERKAEAASSDVVKGQGSS